MFRARISATRWPVYRTKKSYRPFSTKNPGGGKYYLRLRFLNPVIWSIGACSTIYLSFASLDVWRDAQRFKAHGQVLKSVEQLDDLNRKGYYSSVLGKPSSERPEFSNPTTTDKDGLRVAGSLVAITVGAHIFTVITPQTKMLFAHVPGSIRNFTLLTSTFGHSGILHLGVNMYGLLYLMPAALLTPAFTQNGNHVTAFYLSAGILSGLAQHIAAISTGRGILSPSLGASGALLALFGVVGVTFPNMNVGIIFLPGYTFKISEALTWLAIFDAVGIFVRYPGISFAHASHLGGLGLGVAYARYGGDQRLWRPARRVAFKTMHFLRLV